MRRSAKPRAAPAVLRSRSLVFAVLALISSACAAMTITTEAPPSAPVRPLEAHEVVLEDSILEATVVVALAGALEQLDQILPPKIERMGDRTIEPDPDLSKRWGSQWTDKVDGVRLRSEIERKSLRTELDGTTLIIEAEFDIAAVAAIPRPNNRPALIRSCGCRAEDWCGGRNQTKAPPRVTVRIETTLSVDANWRLVPETRSELSIERPCELGRDAGGQTIEAMDALLAPLRTQLDENLATLDQAIAKIDGLRSKTKQVWRALEQPIPFDTDSRQLLLRPLAIGLGELSSEGLRLRAPVRFAMRPVISSDAAPEPAPLPAPRPSTDASGLRLAAGIEIDLDTASEPLRELLVGRRLPNRPARFLRISDASIYGSPTHAIVRLQIDGAAKGELYVRGRLRLDHEAGVIILDDLEVEEDSRKAIASFYDVLEHPDARMQLVPWFTAEDIIELVEAAAVWPISDSVESLRQQIRAAFRRPVSNRLRLSAAIDEVVLTNLWIDGEAIRLAVIAVGGLDVLPREDLEPEAAAPTDAPARLHPRLPDKSSEGGDRPALEPESEPEPEPKPKPKPESKSKQSTD